ANTSIWMHQFAKVAVSKQLNQDFYIQSFAKRLCKIMYYGIKPVFVFDGGVPLLKKETVRKRGRKEDRDEISMIAKRLLRNHTEKQDLKKIVEEQKAISKLLQLFGVPYLIAPMEAEAQCAFLEMNSLVDGIVTDDNDVFLFGGENILRHFFSNSNSELLNYKMCTIREKTGWKRNELIDLALLLGSDYCNGLKGIGKVKAKEILNHFHSIECFVEWFLNGSDENVPSSIVKLRNKIILPDDFNDYKVRDAYLNPTVDQSMEPFQWGSPDFDEIAK
ncbi:PIN domain-like protein, partial [Rozella allomycis CSF55]